MNRFSAGRPLRLSLAIAFATAAIGTFALQSPTKALADTRVQVTPGAVVASFSDDEARAVGLALGLSDGLRKRVALSGDQGRIAFEADVLGTTSRGYPVYHYAARAVARVAPDVVWANAKDGWYRYDLSPQSALEWFGKLKLPVRTRPDPLQSSRMDLKLPRFALSCDYTARGFIPARCIVSFKVKG